jgi:hypothetical protein
MSHEDEDSISGEGLHTICFFDRSRQEGIVQYLWQDLGKHILRENGREIDINIGSTPVKCGHRRSIASEIVRCKVILKRLPKSKELKSKSFKISAFNL